MRAPGPVPYSLFLRSHLVEVLEAAGADEHEGEKDEVVNGVDEGAGGEGTGGEAGEAEDEADAEEKHERAERVAGLVGVHGGEWKAGEDGADDHGGERPLRMTVGAEGWRGFPGAQANGPIDRGAEGGKKEAAEGELFKEGSNGDAEGEEQPCGGGVGEQLVDGRVGGAGKQEFVDNGEDEAE